MRKSDNPDLVLVFHDSCVGGRGIVAGDIIVRRDLDKRIIDEIKDMFDEPVSCKYADRAIKMYGDYVHVASFDLGHIKEINEAILANIAGVGKLVESFDVVYFGGDLCGGKE